MRACRCRFENTGRSGCVPNLSYPMLIHIPWVSFALESAYSLAGKRTDGLGKPSFFRRVGGNRQRVMHEA